MSALAEGAEIRRRRKALGWGAQRFCQEIRRSASELGLPEPGVDIATVSRWERGKRPVSDDYRVLIDHTFSRSFETSGSLEWRTALLRRDFLRHTAGATGFALVAPLLAVDDDSWNRLAAALQGRVRIDGATVTALEDVTSNLTTLFASAPPVVLRPLVDAQLGNLTRFLETTGATDQLRRRLASAAAETSIIAGWIAADGTHESAAAQNAYLMAIDAAEVAGDNAMAAYAIASASCLPAWRSSPEESIRLLQGQDDVAGFRATDATPNVRAWIGSLLAEAHIRAGHSKEAWAALDTAERMLATPDDEPRPRLQFFTEARLHGERGITAVRLGQPTDAISHLDRALDMMGTNEPKLQCRWLNHKARAIGTTGDADTAAAIALDSLQLAVASGSMTSRDQIVSLANHLDRTPAVNELRDALASV